MNTNMHIESVHHVLKFVYLQHKHNRRVDYLIYVLLKIARDKAFDHIQNIEKGKVTHRICDINKRHKSAVSFISLAVIEQVGLVCHTLLKKRKFNTLYLHALLSVDIVMHVHICILVLAWMPAQILPYVSICT